MPNYLDQVLAATRAHNANAARTRSNVSNVLAMVEQQRLAQTLRPPVGGGILATGAPQKHSMGDGHGHTSAAEVKGLNAQFNSALQRMIKDSGGKATVGSGYRSIAQQTKIYNDWKAGRHPAPRVAKPGRSNHNHGLAADLKFANSQARAWFHANAAKYGLRFPMGDEPWHIEPVNARQLRGR